MFYNIILYPLERVIEFMFSLSSHIFKTNAAFSIISVSILISLLTLPLYNVAEKWQEVERNTAKALAPRLKRIKDTFTGDERYMLINTFYRENRYHPVMALRSSISLLIMIPFFTAAYRFLSNLQSLQGKSFLFIRDLSLPDALYTIGPFTLNILPILMTIINLIASIIYTKGHPIKEKVQTFSLAIIFLILLYTSPSGLVLYWTMNNVFSLVKNIFYRLRRPVRALYICASSAVFFVDYYLLFSHRGNINKRLLMVFILSLIFLSPLALSFIKYIASAYLSNMDGICKKGITLSSSLFLLSCASMALLTGLAIPLLIISSSVSEFYGIDGFSPLSFVKSSFTQSIGLFFFWPLCVYLLFGESKESNKKSALGEGKQSSINIRQILSLASFMGIIFSVMNAFIFVSRYGTLTRLMTYSANIAGATKPSSIVLSILSSILVFCLVLFAIKCGAARHLVTISTLLFIALVFVSLNCRIKIGTELRALSLAEKKGDKESEIAPLLHFSRTGKNVVLLMLDNASSALFPTVIREDTDIKNALEDFTYYPHTVSFGGHTIFGAPPIFGGYEYTPFEMNKSSLPLVTKNNNALLMLPRIFSESCGFSATVSDLSWANYSWIPDMSITSPYPLITPLTLERTYSAKWIAANPSMAEPFVLSRAIRRNLLYVSIFRCLLPVLREPFYDEGRWWSESKAGGDAAEFIDYYSALFYMSDMTDIDAKGNCYFTIVNETTHECLPASLRPLLGKDYDDKTVKSYTALQTRGFLESNLLSLRALSSWLSCLKALGVYDNTRIVIVSDHGEGLKEIDGKKIEEIEEGYSSDHLNSLLLVKDFREEGSEKRAQLKTDNSFMTTADVPYILLRGILKSPVNPFTGRAIENSAFRLLLSPRDGIVVTTNGNWTPGKQGRSSFSIKDSEWYTAAQRKSDMSIEYKRLYQ